MNASRMNTVTFATNLKARTRGGKLPRFARSLLFVAVVATLQVGCATQNQTTGATLGAVLGAVIGHAIGGEKGALAGAALGASLGVSIGRQMDAEDRKKLVQAQAQAARANARQTFYSPSAKVDVVVEPSKSYIAEKKQELVLGNDLKSVPVTIQAANAQLGYVDTPVYRSPDYAQTPKLLISKGTEITRIALVDGSDWYLVGQGDYGLGYVHKDYFDESIVSKTAAAAAQQQEAAAQQAAAKRQTASAKKTVPPKKTTVAKATTPPTVTSSLLDANALNLPPKEHFSTPKTASTDYATTAANGARTADAVKSGDQGALSQAKYTPASVECRELVTTLLRDSKALETEKNTKCLTTKGWA